MRWLSAIMLALVMSVLVTGPAWAADAPKDKPKEGAGDKPKDKGDKDKQAPAAVGTIAKIADGVLEVKPKKGDNVKIKVDDKTTVKIDGKAAKLADLKEGMNVVVPAFQGDTAKEVIVRTKDEHEGHDHNKDGKHKGDKGPNKPN